MISPEKRYVRNERRQSKELLNESCRLIALLHELVFIRLLQSPRQLAGNC